MRASRRRVAHRSAVKDSRFARISMKRVRASVFNVSRSKQGARDIKAKTGDDNVLFTLLPLSRIEHRAHKIPIAGHLQRDQLTPVKGMMKAAATRVQTFIGSAQRGSHCPWKNLQRILLLLHLPMTKVDLWRQ